MEKYEYIFNDNNISRLPDFMVFLDKNGMSYELSLEKDTKEEPFLRVVAQASNEESNRAFRNIAADILNRFGLHTVAINRGSVTVLDKEGQLTGWFDEDFFELFGGDSEEEDDKED